MRRFLTFVLSLPKRGALALIEFYRRVISPLKRPCCRFHPSCSQYALEAFRRFGFVRGFLLASWRILRCNPFCRGGIDPVPERFTFRRVEKSDECENNEENN